MNVPSTPTSTLTSTRTTSTIVKEPRVALILAQWHADIVGQFEQSFLEAFKKSDGRSVSVFEVPGAFEIPLLCKQLAATGDYAAIVAGALVVDGGIYRHEFVAGAVVNALMQTQLDTGVPIFSGVLTPQDFTSFGQAEFFRGHFVEKGREAAAACAQTLLSYGELEAA